MEGKNGAQAPRTGVWSHTALGPQVAAPLSGAAKVEHEAAQAVEVSRLAGTEGYPSFEEISNDAIVWAVENGLQMPLSAKASAAYYGYTVEVSELSGKQRMSHLRYTKEGKRQMYERAT